MLIYILFFFWLIFLSWVLTRLKFVKQAGLGAATIIAIFLCKIAAGLVSGKITAGKPNFDTWNYHFEALKEYHLLFTHPKEYVTNLFQTGYSYGYQGVFVTTHSFWNDLKDNLIIKIVSVLHIFSGGNYYTNVVLYNFLTFFGGVAVFRVFDQLYPGRSKLLVTGSFLLPSLLYFGSTIHKDGIIFCALGMLFFIFYQALYISGFTVKKIMVIIICLLPIFLLRSFIFIGLLPALIALVIAVKKKFNATITFSVVYIVAAIIFFNLQYLLPSVNLPQYIVQKQAEFLTLEKGNTTVPVDVLQPDGVSFLKNAPQALSHSLFRPYLTDYALSRMLLPLAAEWWCYQMLLIAFIFFKRKDLSFNHPVIIFSLFFTLSICLVIGYTVPVLGAIVRYRSIYLPFLILPILSNIDWQKLSAIIRFKK